jgi:hypothetical protein
MGTADELALDVLLNMLLGFSAEVAGISRIRVGGEHERWALPGDDPDGEEGEASQRRRKEQQGDVPKVRGERLIAERHAPACVVLGACCGQTDS